MSNRASSHTIVDLLSNFLPVMAWRVGSVCMPYHSWSIRFAVLLRKWLCLNETKPPFLHDNLCWRLYFARQLHIFGKRDTGHSERVFTRSRNYCFNKLYPSSFSDRVHSYVDAVFSWLISFKRILLVGISVIKLWSLSVLRCSFSFLILFFSFANSTQLMLYSVDCSRCSFVKDLMMFLEFWYSVLAISAKIRISIPPNFTGSDSSFYSMLLGIKNFSR